MNKTIRIFAVLMLVGSFVTGYQSLGYAAPKKGIQIENSASVVNINTATLKELQGIRGVGPATAKRIIQYRQENGSFESINDLKKVRGIGKSKLSKIKKKISV